MIKQKEINWLDNTEANKYGVDGPPSSIRYRTATTTLNTEHNYALYQQNHITLHIVG